MDSSDPDMMDDDAFEAELERYQLRPEDGAWGWSVGRVVALFLVVGTIVFWSWALLFAPRGHPDELDDAAFSERAEGRCATALVELERVPAANEARDLDDRAGQIEATTDILTTMVADLREAAPATGQRDGDLVARWLDDWEIYLGDRYAYAADFRAGLNAPFRVTAVGSDQITEPIDLFAEINGMPSCASPGDV